MKQFVATALFAISCVSPTEQLGSAEQASYSSTDHLVVEETAIIGSEQTAYETPPLQVQSIGVAPLAFLGATASGVEPDTWDISPMGELDEAHSLTVFGNTPTSTPSIDNSLIFRVIPGKGGAGGVGLRPNGFSYFDPDHYSDEGRILAIGFMVKPDAMVDIRDLDNQRPHTDCVNHGTNLECLVLNAHSSSHFHTSCGLPIHNSGINALAFGNRASGCALLTNIGLTASAKFGDDNIALRTLSGDVDINVESGSTRIRGEGTADKRWTWNASGNRFATATGGLYNLLIGSEADGTYFVNGNIGYGWSVNATDHLWLNFDGYQGGPSQSRDTFIGNGKREHVLDTIGETKTTKAYGPIESMAGPTWTSGAGSPEGVVSAPNGSLYSRTDCTAGNCLYVKEPGWVNTSWVAK